MYNIEVGEGGRVYDLVSLIFVHIQNHWIHIIRHILLRIFINQFLGFNLYPLWCKIFNCILILDFYLGFLQSASLVSIGIFHHNYGTLYPKKSKWVKEFSYIRDEGSGVKHNNCFVHLLPTSDIYKVSWSIQYFSIFGLDNISH